MDVLILDSELAVRVIQDRKRKGYDRYDEVWDGVYVLRSFPTDDQLKLIEQFRHVMDEAVYGSIFAPVNVSDKRRRGWERNYRVVDLAVILRESRAKEYSAHFSGGPDFLIEMEHEGSATPERLPFFGHIGVNEVLVINRHKRTLRLLRHDGQGLVLVRPSLFKGRQWLASRVLPLAFRQVRSKGAPRTQVRRTDGKPGGLWTV